MLSRTWIPTFLSVALVASSLSCASVATNEEDARATGAWDLKGVDEAGVVFLATLVLRPVENRVLVGYVDWIGDNGSSGREHVAGSFDPRTRVLTFGGMSIEHVDDVVRCEYTAVLSPAGDRLEEGKWTHRDHTVPGTWEATRVET